MNDQFVDVLGSKMHYVETGQGNTILFLHGIPTSSYVWRNLLPHLSTLGRCIALDLIGFGKSDKPDIEYTIFDHIKYVEAFIEKLKLQQITLVMHGWGSVIGLSYAMNHEKNCRGLVFYEAFLRSFSNTEASLPYLEQLSDLDIASIDASYIEKFIKQSTMKMLSDEDIKQYKIPFSTKQAMKPVIQYLNELPRGGGKSAVDNLIEANTKKLMASQLPKLMLYSVPGFVTTIEMIMWAKEHLKNLEIIEIGEELHFGQESNPLVFSETISIWMQGVENTHV
jgi:haloalkane dehalogenase